MKDSTKKKIKDAIPVVVTLGAVGACCYLAYKNYQYENTPQLSKNDIERDFIKDKFDMLEKGAVIRMSTPSSKTGERLYALMKLVSKEEADKELQDYVLNTDEATVYDGGF